MTTLTIELDDATATALQDVPADEREQIAQFLTDYVKTAVQSRERTKRERADALVQTMKEVSAQARANGWTDEMDEALLRGDFDGDE